MRAWLLARLVVTVVACGGGSGVSGNAAKGCAEHERALKSLFGSADAGDGAAISQGIDSSTAHSNKAKAYWRAAGGKWADPSNWKASGGHQANVNIWCGS